MWKLLCGRVGWLYGFCTSKGEDRAIKAVEEALNRLCSTITISASTQYFAQCYSGEEEITMDEIGQITDYVQSRAGYDADLFWVTDATNRLATKFVLPLLPLDLAVVLF